MVLPTQIKVEMKIERTVKLKPKINTTMATNTNIKASMDMDEPASDAKQGLFCFH